MPTAQSLKNFFLNPTEIASLPNFAISLAISALLAFLLGLVYIKFGQSLSNRRVFARNFLLLTVATTLVITIVKSSLALSLGLVGALSIVRFRAAIKEPEELAYLFLAISIGLGLGAGQATLTAAAMLVIFVLIAIRHLTHQAPPTANLYLTVSSPKPGTLTTSQILQALSDCGAAASLRRFDETPDLLEASFQVDFKDAGKLEQFSQKLRALNEKVRISCLDDRGLSA
jgi:hypothetical protein